MRRAAPDPIRPLGPEHAAEIAAWRYPGEYALYNWTEGEDPAALLDGSAYALVNQKGLLVGFYQFGSEARIPAEGESPYFLGFLDMGLGLRPDLCGLGLGKSFVLTGMDFARKELNARALRLTVAAFNQRAQAVYRQCGFRPVGKAAHAVSHSQFVIMTQEESSASPLL